MPMLMERSDRMRTVDRVRKTDRVWFDTIAARAGAISFNVPEAGRYQVIFMRADTNADAPNVLGRTMVESLRVKQSSRIGMMRGIWKLPTEDKDRMMDDEIEKSFDEEGVIA